MKSFLKQVHEKHIAGILIVGTIVIMCLTLALTLNGKVLQDNIFKTFGRNFKPKTTTEQSHKPKPVSGVAQPKTPQAPKSSDKPKEEQKPKQPQKPKVISGVATPITNAK